MRRPTVTVGIPAYNEEGNIKSILNSVLSQTQVNFRISKVFVICDGCTDNTVKIVKSVSKTHKEVECVESSHRDGKANALNKIYDLNKSDYLLVLDADVVLSKTNDLSILVEEIEKDKRINFVGPRHIPVKQKSAMGKFAYYSYIAFEDAFLKKNSGNNFYSVMSAYLLRKSFANSFRYPDKTMADQCYLYAKSTRRSKYGYKFVKSAGVRFMPVSTFNDWRVLGTRSVFGDKADVAKHFGTNILKEYSIPKAYVILGYLKWFLRSPFYVGGSFVMNYYIRRFPIKREIYRDGLWVTTSSSKIGIL